MANILSNQVADLFVLQCESYHWSLVMAMEGDFFLLEGQVSKHYLKHGASFKSILV